MGKSRWEKFQSSYGPVKLDEPNLGSSKFQADWLREAHQERMIINGQPLSVYAEQYNGFVSKEDVQAFFKEVILKDINSVTPAQKQKAVDYLMTAFHQGGLMYPVTSPFATAMVEYNEDYDTMDYYATVGDMDNRITIETTANGFVIQEFASVKFLNVTPETHFEAELKKREDKNYDEECFKLSPDAGKDFVFKVQGKIDIDFTKNPSSPKIDIKSNTISYGNKLIEKRMDKRSLGQIMLDFFKKVLGLNQVKDISAKYDEKSSPKQAEESQVASSSPSTYTPK